MTADDIKFRASAIGHIMTDAQGKSDLQKYLEAVAEKTDCERDYAAIPNKATKTALNKHTKILKLSAEISSLEKTKDQFRPSATCRKEIIRAYARSRGRKEEITNKYLEKGNDREEDSITLFCLETKRFYKKNKIRLENEYVSGEPDLFDGESIHKAKETLDAKSSWSYITFLEAKDKEINPIYDWQGQTYMWLTEAEKHTVFYALVNGTMKFIRDQIRAISWKHGVLDADITDDPSFIKDLQQLERNHIFDLTAFMKENPDYTIRNEFEYDYSKGLWLWEYDIPRPERIHTKVFDRDQNKIDRIKDRVIQCREVLQREFLS